MQVGRVITLTPTLTLTLTPTLTPTLTLIAGRTGAIDLLSELEDLKGAFLTLTLTLTLIRGYEGCSGR